MDFVRGQLVRSKAGRDKTRILAVLAVEGPMLWLADGDLRTRGYSTTQVSLVMSSSLKLWYGFFAPTVCICSLTAAS